MNDLRAPFVAALAQALDVAEDSVAASVVRPPDLTKGLWTFPCFSLARQRRMAPPAIAADLASRIQPPEGTVAEAAGGYLNLRPLPGVLPHLAITWMLELAEDAPLTSSGAGRCVLVDYSSPNAGKELVYHHIRSTVLGAALCRLHKASGWDVVAVNHLGDWGTQFGKLILMWLCEHGRDETAAREALTRVDLPTLNRLYVGFRAAAAIVPALEEEARSWFVRLEDGDKFAQTCWARFIEVSIEALQAIYSRLGAAFDHFLGESFYLDKLESCINRIRGAGILEESDGAYVVHVGEGIPPCLVRKRDGATLYATRDLAAALWRHQRFCPARVLYVVDAGQSLHFRQVFEVLRRMGEPCASTLEHVAFGLVLGRDDDGNWSKVSTRSGTGAPLDEVLDLARRRILDVLSARGSEHENPLAVAEAVGVGALVFNELKGRRLADTRFDLEAILSFEGDTGPYIQYAHVRLASILRKAGTTPSTKGARWSLLCEAETENVALLISQLPSRVEAAVESCEPSIVAQYALELAEAVHVFTHRHRVIDVEQSPERLLLVDAARRALARALTLLGLQPLERM